MKPRTFRRHSTILRTIISILFVWAPAVRGVSLPDGGNSAVEFDRDVRPILSENCFKCHGPDASQRMAGLRLDLVDGSRKKLDSGHAAIVPGYPAKSELAKRISATNALRMPPEASGKKLTAAQKATLVAWI